MTAHPSPDPNVTQAVPFLWVRDMDAATRFYVDGLGFVIAKRWTDDGKLRWCWLELGGAGLMLQEFWTAGPHRNVPAGEVGLGVSLTFVCRDALAIYRDARVRGLDPTRPFVGNGMWVTQLSDPDGYRLCFESATDAPEETVYADTDVRR